MLDIVGSVCGVLGATDMCVAVGRPPHWDLVLCHSMWVKS